MIGSAVERNDRNIGLFIFFIRCPVGGRASWYSFIMLQCAASQGLFVPGGLHFLHTSANSFASDAPVKGFTMDDRRLKQPGGTK